MLINTRGEVSDRLDDFYDLIIHLTSNYSCNPFLIQYNPLKINIPTNKISEVKNGKSQR